MGHGIAMTRKCSYYVTPSVRNQVIQALVLSHLRYCMVVWSSAAVKHIKKLEAKVTSSLVMFTQNTVDDRKPDYYFFQNSWFRQAQVI